MSDSAALLAEGFAGNVTVLRELQFFAGLSNESAAHSLLVSPETYRRWRCDRHANPTAVRLLAVLAGYLPWSAWHGWELHAGCLFPPGYTRHGLKPGEIMAMPFVYQLIGEYRRELDELRLVRPAGEVRQWRSL